MTIILEDMVKLVGVVVKSKCQQGIGKPDSAMKVFRDLLGLTEENFIATKSNVQVATFRILWPQEYFGKKVVKESWIYAHFPKLPYVPEVGLRKRQEYYIKWIPKKNVRFSTKMLQEIRQALDAYSVDD
ncbi:hypothetical protein GIB67_042660, partial [Kingdonia uniflora]